MITICNLLPASSLILLLEAHSKGWKCWSHNHKMLQYHNWKPSFQENKENKNEKQEYNIEEKIIED